MKQIRKEMKTWILGVIVSILVTGFFFCYQSDAFSGTLWVGYQKQEGEGIPVSFNKVSSIEQGFYYIQNITQINLWVKNTGKETEHLNLSIYRSEDNQLLAQTQAGIETKHGKKQKIKVPITMQELPQSPGRQGAYLVITPQEKKNHLSIWKCRRKGIKLLHGYREGQGKVEKREHLMLEMQCAKIGLLHLKRISFICMLAACLLFFLSPETIGVKRKRKNSASVCFLIMALLIGTAFAITNPFGQECDGEDHFRRSMDVSYGNVLYPFVSLTHQNGEITVPKNMDDIEFQIVGEGSGYGTWLMMDLKTQKFSNQTVQKKYDGGVTSFFYLPQALGLVIARVCKLSIYWSMILARLCNLLVYTILTAIAIRVIPIGKHVLMAVALMPLSLYQAASVSADALLNALCFLFLALCLSYALEEKRKLGIRQALLLSGVLLYIFIGKYVYVCIGLLVFMIPVKRFGGIKNYVKAFSVAMIPLLLVGGFLFIHMTQSVQTLQDTANGMTQTQYVLSNPIQYGTVLMDTFWRYISGYVVQLNYLGWLQYDLGPFIILVPLIVVVTGVLDINGFTKKFTKKQRILCMATCLLLWVAIMTGMYIGDPRFNPVGSKTVDGCQGRYFIPLLMLPILAFQNKNLTTEIKYFPQKVAGLMGICSACSVVLLIGYCY